MRHCSNRAGRVSIKAGNSELVLKPKYQQNFSLYYARKRVWKLTHARIHERDDVLIAHIELLTHGFKLRVRATEKSASLSAKSFDPVRSTRSVLMADRVFSVEAADATYASRNRVIMNQSVMVEMGLGIGDHVLLSSVANSEVRSRPSARNSAETSESDSNLPKTAFAIAWPGITGAHSSTQIRAAFQLHVGSSVGSF